MYQGQVCTSLFVGVMSFNPSHTGETAGIRLGDIIFGVNFVPVREGSATLISILKDEIDVKRNKYIHIQGNHILYHYHSVITSKFLSLHCVGWRCHQLCSDPVPGYLFPKADEMLVQAFALGKSMVFSVQEKWNFIEILLR